MQSQSEWTGLLDMGRKLQWWDQGTSQCGIYNWGCQPSSRDGWRKAAAGVLRSVFLDNEVDVVGHPSRDVWWAIPWSLEGSHRSEKVGGEPLTSGQLWEFTWWRSWRIHNENRKGNKQTGPECRIRDMGHEWGTQRELKNGLTVHNQRAERLCLRLWGFQETVLAGKTTTLSASQNNTCGSDYLPHWRKFRGSTEQTLSHSSLFLAPKTTLTPLCLILIC